MTALQETAFDPVTPFPGQTGDIAEPRTYVTFELSGQVFAVDVANVREILDLQPIAPLPNAPGELLGMVDVRGEGIAVVDLPGKLSMMSGRERQDGRIVVFELGAAPPTAVGVIADRVLSVIEIPQAEIEPAPSAMTRWDAAAMRGVARVAGRLTMILALDALFGDSARGDFDFA